ncbi:MAG: hypothetical protein HY886_00585 [Deltaproteobacteria bacterium]|nr:hypothetical protein [Deltaproteobacteria bacterium]
MSEYVARVRLEVNGNNIDDFKSVEEEEVELHKEVNLMNKTGVVGVTPRYKVNVDYVVPKDSEEFDFTEVKDGTLTIDYDNGKRIQFAGVTVLKIGSTSYDGEKEATRKIALMATGRTEG